MDKPIENCPSCNSKLSWNETFIDLYCYNDMCQSKSIRRLLHFFQTLNNLDGFGPKTIERLIKFGYDSINKIYDMSYQDFLDCGYKHQTIMNLGSELAESRERKIAPYTFIAALGVNHLGIGSSKKLTEHYDYNSLLDLKADDLILIDGFGHKTSFEIEQEILYRQEEIFDIINIGFNIVEEEKAESIQSKITGKRICFTGKSVHNRKDMQKQAEKLGAIPVNSVNSKTDILVTGSKVGANKLIAAKKFGTEIYTEDEYFEFIGDLS